MKRYFVRILDTGEAPMNVDTLKKVIRLAVYNPRFRTMDEGDNSTEKVLTFTPEPEEVGSTRNMLRHHFPGRTIILKLERKGEV